MIFQVVVGKELVSSALPRLKSTNSRFLSLEAASHYNIYKVQYNDLVCESQAESDYICQRRERKIPVVPNTIR